MVSTWHGLSSSQLDSPKRRDLMKVILMTMSLFQGPLVEEMVSVSGALSKLFADVGYA